MRIGWFAELCTGQVKWWRRGRKYRDERKGVEQWVQVFQWMVVRSQVTVKISTWSDPYCVYEGKVEHNYYNHLLVFCLSEYFTFLCSLGMLHCGKNTRGYNFYRAVCVCTLSSLYSHTVVKKLMMYLPVIFTVTILFIVTVFFFVRAWYCERASIQLKIIVMYWIILHLLRFLW